MRSWFWMLLALGCTGLQSSCQPTGETPSQGGSAPSTEDRSTSEPKWVSTEMEPFPSPSSEVDTTGVPQASSSESQTESSPPAQTQTIYRPDDDRLTPDPALIERLDIKRYASPRLILYSDIDPEIARTLPPVVNSAYDAMEAYFGPPPPSRTGEEFQLTGYLIGEQDRFRTAELIPDAFIDFLHGKHRGQEFWAFDQEFDYYRRHLIIHEATHCYTMIMPGLHPPIWYLEGIAELFATHRITDDGSFEFCIMPQSSQGYRGFGRIEVIQNEVAAGRMLSVDQVTELGTSDFANSRLIPYAWCWALCQFLNSHPRYQDRFQQLAQNLEGNAFAQLAERLFAPDKELLNAEWEQFIRRIEYGWEFRANGFVVSETAPRTSLTSPLRVKALADKGWQSCDVIVEAGETLSISATGRVTLANTPRPWLSEAQGVSIRYANGVPIGRLQVGVLVDTKSIQAEEPLSSQFEVYDCGQHAELRIKNRGLLMMFVNDFGSERSDNSGLYEVQIERRP